MARFVLFLEDDPQRMVGLRSAVSVLDASFKVQSWDTAVTMLDEYPAYLDEAVLISLDHDLYPDQVREQDPGDGLQIARSLANRPPRCPVIIHSTNTDRALQMQGALDLANWICKRVRPSDEQWITRDWLAVARELLWGEITR